VRYHVSAVATEYDVVLSFAGEDRSYVNLVAEELRRNQIRVFYDAYEEAELWGKDLYQHLSTVYGERARYCVIFISTHYAEKLWTRHELASAQARAFRENREYLLPARFDDTELPGILPTVGYVDLRKKGPVEFAATIARKLGRTPQMNHVTSVLSDGAPAQTVVASLSGTPIVEPTTEPDRIPLAPPANERAVRRRKPKAALPFVIAVVFGGIALGLAAIGESAAAGAFFTVGVLALLAVPAHT
jgi:hypothetical protein